MFLPELALGDRPGLCVLLASGYSAPAFTSMFELIDGIPGTETNAEWIADLAKRGHR